MFLSIRKAQILIPFFNRRLADYAQLARLDLITFRNEMIAAIVGAAIGVASLLSPRWLFHAGSSIYVGRLIISLRPGAGCRSERVCEIAARGVGSISLCPMRLSAGAARARWP